MLQRTSYTSRRALSAVFTIALVASACGGGTNSAGNDVQKTSAPSGLTYSVSSAIYTVNEPIPPNTPTSSGGAVVSYSISPALPPGLSLNMVSGAISGTPTAVAATTTYILTARNSAGSTTAGISITVNAVVVPPSGLTYLVNPALYTVGTPVTPNIPSSSGGAVVAYSVSPSLPPGLSLNKSTGVISGTPSAVTPTSSYTVTATNSGGSTTVGLTITVGAAVVPPIGLTYSVNPAAYTVSTPIAPNTPSSSGSAVISYSVKPDLPAGLSLNTSTGIISGIPSAVTPSAVYTITATNSAGATSVGVSITVSEVVYPPSGLTYAVNPAIYTVGMPIVPNGPSSSGGAVVSYSVAPALPAGLSLNTSSGVVSGTPSQVAATSKYTFTAENAAGTTSATVLIAVTGALAPLPNVDLLTSSVVHPNDDSIVACVPPQNGVTYEWAVLSGAATGEITSGLDTNSIRLRIGGTEGTLQVQVTVRDARGFSKTATRELRVGRNTWIVNTGGSSTPRTSGTLTNIGGGRLLAAGGALRNDTPDRLASTEVFDPWESRWFRTGDLNVPRRNHTATALGDGKVLVAGGGKGAADSSELFDPGAGTWSIASPLNVGRERHAAVLLRSGRVLVMGGIDSTGTPTASAEIYDPIARAWSFASGLTVARYDHTATMLSDGRVIVVGGFDSRLGTFSGALDSVEIYDEVTDSWYVGPPLNQKRSSHTATLLGDGSLLVAGGALQDYNAAYGMGVTTDEIYDPSTNLWTSVPGMLTPRHHHAAALTPHGAVLVAGGYEANIYSLRSAELFDPVTKSWSRTSSLIYNRTSPMAAQLPDGRILVAGGFVGTAKASSEIFDPVSENWTVIGPTPVLPVYGMTATLADGRILVSDGDAYVSTTQIFDPLDGSWRLTGSPGVPGLGRLATLADGRVLRTTSRAWSEVFDPSTELWRAAGDPATRRQGHTLTVLQDGRVLMAGGGPYSSPLALNTAELFDPSTGTWTATGAMAVARREHTATLLADGRVLVAGGSPGGYNPDPMLASAEIYDPQTGAWTSTGSMTRDRSAHTAVLLQDGSVLVVGGQDSTWQGVARCELYVSSTGTWTTLQDLTASSSVALLSDGRVLVVRGDSQCAALFDPQSRTWLPGGCPNFPNGRFLTPRPDGSVVAILGADADTVSEVFVP